MEEKKDGTLNSKSNMGIVVRIVLLGKLWKEGGGKSGRANLGQKKTKK